MHKSSGRQCACRGRVSDSYSQEAVDGASTRQNESTCKVRKAAENVFLNFEDPLLGSVRVLAPLGCAEAGMLLFESLSTSPSI